MRHAIGRRRGRDETDEREWARRETLLEHGIRADREIGDQHAVRAGTPGPIECIGSRGEHRIEITEQHDRNGERCPRDELEHFVVRHPLRQGALRARLDHGPVRHGIGEWNADFYHIRARPFECTQDLNGALEVRMARGDVHDERLASLLPQRRKALHEHRCLR